MCAAVRGALGGGHPGRSDAPSPAPGTPAIVVRACGLRRPLVAARNLPECAAWTRLSPRANAGTSRGLPARSRAGRVQRRPTLGRGAGEARRGRASAISQRPPGLATILREWGRIGCIGFGGPPTHIALLRQLCVEQHRWLDAAEFEDAIAACNLLPGPASTQLAIFCAWRLRGRLGAVVGAIGFIVPGLVVILALASVFLNAPPLWIRGAGAGAGAAVAAVALRPASA